MKLFSKVFSAFVLILSMILSVSKAESAVPRKLSYQGVLSNARGEALTGSHQLTFRLYDDLQAGTLVWEETQQAEVDRGVFQVILGSNEPLNIDFEKPVWMSIELNQEGEMSPRIPIVSVIYALNAATLDSINADQFLRSDLGGEIAGSLNIKGVLSVNGVPISSPDLSILLKVGIVAFLAGALGGALSFLLIKRK